MSRIDVERREGVRVARPRGDIDAANASSLREELASLLDPGAETLVVDLGEIRYLDSAGIDMLLRLGALLGERRATLMVVIPPQSQLTRLAAIVGLPDAMPVHDTVEAAVTANAARIASIAAIGDAPQLPAEERPQ
jgi:anti-anti-sigma factor